MKLRGFLINLERNGLRLEKAAKQLAALGIDFERFPAVDGRALSTEQRRSHVAEFRSRMARLNRLTPGEVGCALSHMFVLKKMIDEQIEAAVIFEDDVVLSKAFSDALDLVRQNIDPKRPQVYLFTGAQVGGLNLTGLPAFQIVAVKTALLADAYVITREAAQQIFRVNYPIITMNDWWGRWCRRGLIELYRVVPACSAQRRDEFVSEVTPNKLPRLRGLRWLFWKFARAPCLVIDWGIWFFLRK